MGIKDEKGMIKVKVVYMGSTTDTAMLFFQEHMEVWSIFIVLPM